MLQLSEHGWLGMVQLGCGPNHLSPYPSGIKEIEAQEWAANMYKKGRGLVTPHLLLSIRPNVVIWLGLRQSWNPFHSGRISHSCLLRS